MNNNHWLTPTPARDITRAQYVSIYLYSSILFARKEKNGGEE